MLRKEKGEREFVLENRQILITLAVLTSLFCVFFSTGYFAGRKYVPTAPLVISDTQPAPVERGPSPVIPPTSAVPGSTSVPKGSEPARPGDRTEVRSDGDVVPKPPAQTARPSKPADNVSSVQVKQSLEPGAYLQVMAVKQVDAANVAKALQDKGFPALVTPSPVEGLFRVLVGPYQNVTGLKDAKAELENSGFHPLIQKVASH